MGRSKQYDRDNIVRKAMKIFWQHGYEATSTQMLVDAMDINRFSVYAEFGSKQALYTAALSCYYKEVVCINLSILEAPNASIEAVSILIQNMVNWRKEDNSTLGCFICNAATERAPVDTDSQTIVQSYIDRLTQGFSSCLYQAQKEQKLKPNVDPLSEGQLLTTMFLGLLVQLRAQVSQSSIGHLGIAAQTYLQRLQKEL